MVFESTNEWPSYEGQEREVPPPLSSYGFQKLAVEYFARAAWDQYRLPYTIVRPFNCVGIGESRALGDAEILSGNVQLAMSHVVPDLVQKVLKGQDPLHILGSGDQVRHYTYGGDLARGVVDRDGARGRARTRTSTSPPRRAPPSLQLAEVIWRKVKGDGVPLRIVHDEPFEYDVQRRVPSTEKAKRSSASRPPPRWMRCSTRSSPGSTGHQGREPSKGEPQPGRPPAAGRWFPPR